MPVRKNPFYITLIVSVFLYSFKAGEEKKNLSQEVDPPFLTISTPWADSVFNTLSQDERIAQLFMVAAYSNRDEKHENELKDLIENYGIGGLIYFQGGPVRQATMCNRLQSYSKIPMMIGMDAEWGLAMRLDSTIKYPWQMTLGAIENDQLIFKMGRQIGEQLKRMGVHINFAPVVDINVNPENPVINARSFGENRENVAEKGIAYMLGLQSERIIANAKHFPGHGDTDKDSHKTLPMINHTGTRLDSVEMYPFRKLMESGLSSVMIAHLYVPALVDEFNYPTTLSRKVVTELLKDSLRFEGLVVTDALNMKGVSSQFKPGEVDVKALLAGNDVLLFSEDVPKAIDEINKAVKEGLITYEEIDRRCLKILRAKEWVGLGKYKPIETDSLFEDLNKTEYQVLLRELFRSSLTLLENKKDFLPLRSLDTLKIAAVAMGDGGHEAFHRFLSMYAQVDTFSLPFNPDPIEHKKILDKLEDHNLIIASVHTSDRNPYSRFKIQDNSADFLNILRLKKEVILTSFANPYALRTINGLDHFTAMLQAYQNSENSNELAAQAIFGALKVNGKLPVSINRSYPSGFGLEVSDIQRFNYVIPEEIGIQREWLTEIDSIALEGIKAHAYPGCQVMVASHGKVFYNRTFGYHSYDSSMIVRVNDVYDLASVTKIAATLPVVMELQEKGIINLDFALCDYIPELVDTSEYANLSLREILAHQAGLAAWIPFYKKTMLNGSLRYDVFSLDSSEIYSRQIANNLWINKAYEDTIYKQILRTPLNGYGEYKYSDLGYYFLKRIVEKLTGEKLDVYLERTYYGPLGMNRTFFNPLHKLSLNEIIPTENDLVFRKQMIQGFVHDPGAAMLGGVGGHAGLFSNANDLAKLMQMYINGGTYGGMKYLGDSVINEFTACQYCQNDNRRGAGFDKPMINNEKGGPTCTCVSYLSFGHSGFTGTYAWADPQDELVYIFLSNRVHPDAGNKELVNLSIRTRIQEVIYSAVERSKHLETERDSVSKK